MKERIQQIKEVAFALIWRGFGVFLYILGGSAGVGALVTGDPFMGVVIAWGTLMLGIVGVIGYAIATTGKVTKQDVAKGVQDAVQKVKEENDKK
jgi:hypothetical protein